MIGIALSIIKTITGDVPSIIEYILYISDASSIIGYTAYLFWHK